MCCMCTERNNLRHKIRLNKYSIFAISNINKLTNESINYNLTFFHKVNLRAQTEPKKNCIYQVYKYEIPDFFSKITMLNLEK